jgi:peptidoglycan/LPS O-acetylase OafA/YrhL
MHFILLDGYRGIAAVIVLIFHALVALRYKELMPFGSLAVDFFYCLSGFVICHSYQNRLKNSMSLPDFMRIRIIRLYPMIAIGLIIGLMFFILRLILSHKWERLAPGIGAFLLNAFLLPSPFTQLANGAAWPLNGAHWSLSFEMLANALFAALLVRLSKSAFYGLTLFSFIVLVYFALQLPEFDIGWGWADLWFGVIRVMFPFMAGVLIYWSHIQNREKTQLKSPFFGLILGLGLGLSLIAPSILIPKSWYSILFIGFISPALIYLGAAYTPTDKQANIFKKLGELSFPLYAIHLPLIRFTQGFAERGFPDNEMYRVVLVLSSALISIPLALFCQKHLEPKLKTQLQKIMAGAPRPASVSK